MQEIVVFVIVAIAAAYVVRTVVSRLRSKPRNAAACAKGCGNCRGCG